jgi:hypothetical protein
MSCKESTAFGGAIPSFHGIITAYICVTHHNIPHGGAEQAKDSVLLA